MVSQRPVCDREYCENVVAGELHGSSGEDLIQYVTTLDRSAPLLLLLSVQGSKGPDYFLSGLLARNSRALDGDCSGSTGPSF